MTEKVEYDLKEILIKLDSRFETLETKLESRFEKIDSKFEALEAKLESRFEKIDSKFEALETKLESRFEKLETKLDRVSVDVADVKTNLVRVEATFKGEIEVLSKDIQGTNKRLDGQEFINRGVAIGLLVALLGGLAKLFGFDEITK